MKNSKSLIALLTILSFYASTINAQTKTDFRSMPGIIQMKEMKYSVDHNSRQSLLDEVIYKFDMNGKLIEIELNSSESINRITFLYDSNGKLIEESCYRGTIMKHRYRYSYDQQGKLTEEKCFDRNNNILFTNTLTYNSSGKILEKSSDIPVKFSIKNFYNSLNQNIKSEVTSTSATQREIEYQYDMSGRLEREIVYTSLKRSTTGKRYQMSRIDYEYDNTGKLKSKRNYLTDTITEKFLYNYNDANRLTHWERYNPQGNLVYKVEYEYIEN